MLRMSPKPNNGRLMLRLPKEDLAKWREVADDAGLPLSTWIRVQCNAAAAKAPRAKK